MKKLLLCLFLICTLNTFAQSKGKGFFSVDFGMVFPKGENPALGANFSGGGVLKNSALIGGQIGIIKFQGVNGVYFPLQAKFAFAPSFTSKASPIVMLEPGVGLYGRNYRIANTEISTSGGFVFFGGAGVRFNDRKSKGSGFIAIGYSTYGFTTNNVSSNLQGVCVRFGALLF